jgi:hypothetical protein
MEFIMIPVFLLLASAIGLILTDKKEKADKKSIENIPFIKNPLIIPVKLNTPSTFRMSTPPTNAALMQSKQLTEYLKIDIEKNVDLYNNLLKQQEEYRSALGTEFEE